MNIEFASIPEFLQTGELYKILREQEESVVMIDPKYYTTDYTDPNLTIQKFTAIMETIRYWGLETLPDFVYQYILLHNRSLSADSSFRDAIYNTIYEQELLFLMGQLDIEGCIENGFTGMIRYVMKNTRELAIIQQTTYNTTLYECDSEPDVDYYLIDYDNHINDYYAKIINKSEMLARLACQYGQIELLKLFIEEFAIQIDYNVFITSITNNQNACLEYLTQKYPDKTFNYHISLLGYAIQYKNEKSIEIVLDSIREKTPIRIYSSHMTECIDKNAYNIFILLYPFWEKNARRRNIKWVVETASHHHRIEFIKYVYQKERRWVHDTADIMVVYGFIDGLRFAIQSGCQYNTTTLAIAAYHNQLECMKYLRECGVEWSYSVSCAAVENGKVDSIKYLLENGCPFTEKSVEMIRLHGHNELAELVVANQK